MTKEYLTKLITKGHSMTEDELQDFAHKHFNLENITRWRNCLAEGGVAVVITNGTKGDDYLLRKGRLSSKEDWVSHRRFKMGFHDMPQTECDAIYTIVAHYGTPLALDPIFGDVCLDGWAD